MERIGVLNHEGAKEKKDTKNYEILRPDLWLRLHHPAGVGTQKDKLLP